MTATTPHRTHDIQPGSWRCRQCLTLLGSLDIGLPCPERDPPSPAADAQSIPCDVEAVDWAA